MSFLFMFLVSIYLCIYLLNCLSSQIREAEPFMAAKTGATNQFKLPKFDPDRTTFGMRGPIFCNQKRSGRSIFGRENWSGGTTFG